MDRRGRLAVSAVFAIAIGTSVWQGGSGIVVSLGAGVLGGAILYLMGRLLSGGG